MLRTTSRTERRAERLSAKRGERWRILAQGSAIRVLRTSLHLLAPALSLAAHPLLPVASCKTVNPHSSDDRP